jgi:hypothetical protein
MLLNFKIYDPDQIRAGLMLVGLLLNEIICPNGFQPLGLNFYLKRRMRNLAFFAISLAFVQIESRITLSG